VLEPKAHIETLDPVHGTNESSFLLKRKRRHVPEAVSILGGRWGDLPLFLRIHPNFLRGRGKILHRQRRKKINKCNKFSLFVKNPPFFDTKNRHCELRTRMVSCP
jgi:hypothetical protein